MVVPLDADRATATTATARVGRVQGEHVQLLTPDSGVRSRARSRLRWVSVLVAVLGVAASVWALQPAEPAGLQSARPDRSAHLERAPDEIRLDFAAAPAPGSLAEVAVLSPGDANLARGPVTSSAGGASQAVADLRERGAYQVVYEVPLVDGDVARGQYWFWYTPGASGSSSRLESPALLGLLIAMAAALAAGLLAPGRARTSAVRIPAQRTESPVPTTSTHQVPAQRSRDSHEGISHPGRARSGPGRSPRADQPTTPVPPREV